MNARFTIGAYQALNATRPRGTLTPLAARMALPWYSWSRAIVAFYFDDLNRLW